MMMVMMMMKVKGNKLNVSRKYFFFLDEISFLQNLNKNRNTLKIFTAKKILLAFPCRCKFNKQNTK